METCLLHAIQRNLSAAYHMGACWMILQKHMHSRGQAAVSTVAGNAACHDWLHTDAAWSLWQKPPHTRNAADANVMVVDDGHGQIGHGPWLTARALPPSSQLAVAEAGVDCCAPARMAAGPSCSLSRSDQRLVTHNSLPQ